MNSRATPETIKLKMLEGYADFLRWELKLENHLPLSEKSCNLVHVAYGLATKLRDTLIEAHNVEMSKYWLAPSKEESDDEQR